MARPEGNDISIQDFLEENQSLSQSILQQAYDKSSILLTGVTSFIGSVILEKILRSCPTIESIYVLIREKNGLSAENRLKELFRSPIFDRIKMEQPVMLNKVHVIACDLCENDLGIGNDDYLMLVSKVNTVIHTARLVGSGVRFKQAVLINIKALQSILKLCHEMRKLDAVLYMSSAFVFYNETVIEEIFYPCNINGTGLINMVDNFPEETLDAITPSIISEYPNISLLTLAVAENIINDSGEGLPISVVRPPFILASCNEPIAGWIQPQREESPTDILLNVFLGKVFTLHCDGRKPLEAVPVDMVANLIIAVVGHLLLKRKEWINQAIIISTNNTKTSVPLRSDTPDIQIYNMCSLNKQLTWSKFFEQSILHQEEAPFNDTIWYSPLTINKYWILHWVLSCVQLGHFKVTDKIKSFLGINSELLEDIRNIHKTSETILKFCKKFRIKNENVTNLWDSMSTSDQRHFDFNLKSLDWNQFFYTQCRGLRVYLMNDPLSTVPNAKLQRNRMKRNYKIAISLMFVVISFLVYVTIKLY